MATAEQTAPTVQWVCDPERVAVCKCSTDTGKFAAFTCDCMGRPNIAGNCDCCGSVMILINVDTGELVEAKAS